MVGDARFELTTSCSSWELWL